MGTDVLFQLGKGRKRDRIQVEKILEHIIGSDILHPPVGGWWLNWLNRNNHEANKINHQAISRYKKELEKKQSQDLQSGSENPSTTLRTSLSQPEPIAIIEFFKQMI